MKARLGRGLILGIAVTAALLAAVLAGLSSYRSAREKRGGSSDHFFSRDYHEARRKFLEAARSAGASLESFPGPSTGKEATPLAIDTALLGPVDARSVLVIISGTHGVEGFAGSALQTSLLRAWDASRLEPDTAVFMIHALNPYGFAALRRFNEDNVDLNRNFLDHSLPYPDNRGYERLHEALAPSSLSPLATIRSTLVLGGYLIRHGAPALRDAVTLGQYSHPDGLFFGGNAEAWSNRTFREIAARHLSRSERVVVMEVHTGLGGFGDAEIILNERRTSPAFRRARDWWGSRVKSTVDEKSVSRDISGSVKRAFPSMLPHAEVTAVSLEFGTYPARKVLRALRADNWLHHHGSPDHPRAVRIKGALREAFNPDSGLWRERVILQGKDIVEEALRRLPVDSPRRSYLKGGEPLFLEGGDSGLLLLHGAGGGSTTSSFPFFPLPGIFRW